MQIVWTTPALDDLRNINDWLKRGIYPERALRTLRAIRHRARVLEDFLHGGRPTGADQRILRVHETPYLIRCGIGADGVQVLPVHHERTDWQFAP